LGEVVLGEDYIDFNLDAINAYATKVSVDKNIPLSEIHCYLEKREVNEFRDKQVFVVFYHNAEETDKEYAARMEKLEVKDLLETLQEIRRFNTCVSQKKELRELYNKLVTKGKYKGIRDEVFDVFFNTKHDAEKVQDAYKKGYAAGIKETEMLKEKLKSLSI
jgi:hypothetical protein